MELSPIASSSSPPTASQKGREADLTLLLPFKWETNKETEDSWESDQKPSLSLPLRPTLPLSSSSHPPSLSPFLPFSILPSLSRSPFLPSLPP